MFEDKAIPSRPFLPGYTSLRDRLGADLSLGENTIKMNTLGDVSSILITSPITLPLPNNNFTTLGVSSNSNFIIPNQTLNMTSSSEIMSQVTSSITPTSSLNLIDQQLNTLPTTEDPNLIPPSVVQEQEVSSSVIYSSNLLPAQDNEFINLYEDNIVEIAQDTGYIPLDFPIEIRIQNSPSIVKSLGKNSQEAYDKAEQLEPGFKKAVQNLAKNIGANEMDLVKVMYSESGIQNNIVNSIGSVGLIQFTPDPSTPGKKKIGNKVWAMSEIKALTRIQQLQLVETYFKAQKPFPTIYDLYLFTFYPVAKGKSNNWVFGSENKNPNYKFIVANQNQVLAKLSTATIDGKKVINIEAFKKYINLVVTR